MEKNEQIGKELKFFLKGTINNGRAFLSLAFTKLKNKFI